MARIFLIVVFSASLVLASSSTSSSSPAAPSTSISSEPKKSKRGLGWLGTPSGLDFNPVSAGSSTSGVYSTGPGHDFYGLGGSSGSGSYYSGPQPVVPLGLSSGATSFSLPGSGLFQPGAFSSGIVNNNVLSGNHGAGAAVPGNFGALGLWNSPVISDLSIGRTQLPSGGLAPVYNNLGSQTLQSEHRPLSAPLVYAPDVVRAVQYAKEASQQVHLAQRRVDEAKQAALIQQKITLARELAAREASQRSEAVASQAAAEARASAKQLVALQQRLANLKDAVAAAQRFAAARETAAAAAIQRTAADTAAELRRQDVDKQISQAERESRERDLIAAREHAFAVAAQHASSIAQASHQHQHFQQHQRTIDLNPWG